MERRLASRLCLFGFAASVPGLAACSVNNLTYDQVLRDLDAAVAVEGAGEEERIVYRTDVEATWGIARWSTMKPFLWFLLPLFGDLVTRELDNPSGYARELAEALAPKAGNRLDRCVEVALRLARIAEIDPSPLNRIVALGGLAEIAGALGIELLADVPAYGVRIQLHEKAVEWRDCLSALRPAARTPVGGPLNPSDLDAYRSCLLGLSSRPLPLWRQRIALLADLRNASLEERQPDLAEMTRQALDLALTHLIRQSILEASQGRNRELAEVRLRAVELLHRSGGADSVPLLLALVAASPEQIQEGQPQFEENDAIRLRFVHMCGQLDRDRALRTATIPGRTDWQKVAPAEYLARLALDGEPFLSTTALPAREALAFSLKQSDADPEPGSDGSQDWVLQWWHEYRKEQPLK